jgi:hypothetical protein
MTQTPPQVLEGELSMPLMKLPLRAVAVAVPGGRVLISPGSTFSEAQLREAGEITDIVAPNLWHLDGIPQAARVFPQARVWGPIGAKEKLPDAPWSAVLGQDAWPYEEALAHLPLAGMPKVAESLFCDRASQTLVTGDLVFNIENPRGVGPWIMLHLFGTYKRFGVSRLYLGMVHDKDALRQSLAPLADMKIERIMPGHGAIVETDAHRRLAAALAERKLG